MNVRAWVAQRGGGYLGHRAAALLARYGVSPGRAMRRVRRCVEVLAGHGCAPTLPTPGRVIGRYPAFFRELQDLGVEIAVHSYDHVDLAACGDGADQLAKAARTFDAYGIERRGFRCPYLRCTPQLLDHLPSGLYEYSSNQGIWWGTAHDAVQRATAAFDVLQGFYRPLAAEDYACIPWVRSGLVEIPVSLPDDLQLHDGLGLGPGSMADEWRRVLAETHRRGEAFVLQFHPELGDVTLDAFRGLLSEAAGLRPPVWVARLRDISDWWRERATHDARVVGTPSGVRLRFDGSPRATIVARGLDLGRAAHPWAGRYRRVTATEVPLPEGPLPFVGLSDGAPPGTASFLHDMGYLVRCGQAATRCSLMLDDALLARCRRQRDLVAHIEASDAPLVRYWPWPDGARSALCITGDLDALSLIDYGFRFIARGC